MIISKLVEIERTEELSTEYIEGELNKQGIEPLRWAITAAEQEKLTVSVSFETKE